MKCILCQSADPRFLEFGSNLPFCSKRCQFIHGGGEKRLRDEEEGCGEDAIDPITREKMYFVDNDARIKLMGQCFNLDTLWDWISRFPTNNQFSQEQLTKIRERVNVRLENLQQRGRFAIIQSNVDDFEKVVKYLSMQYYREITPNAHLLLVLYMFNQNPFFVPLIINYELVFPIYVLVKFKILNENNQAFRQFMYSKNLGNTKLWYHYLVVLHPDKIYNDLEYKPKVFHYRNIGIETINE